MKTTKLFWPWTTLRVLFIFLIVIPLAYLISGIRKYGLYVLITLLTTAGAIFIVAFLYTTFMYLAFGYKD